MSNYAEHSQGPSQGWPPRAPGSGRQGPPELETPRNGLGIASLVLGIVGICFAWIPVVGFVGFVLGVVGLPLGIAGVSRVRKHRATNRGVAWTGTVLSAVTVVVSTVVWLGTLAAVDEELQDDAATDSATPSEAQPRGDAETATGEAEQSDESGEPGDSGNGSNDGEPQGTDESADGEGENEPTDDAIGDGVWVVGEDIEPGRYETDGPSGDLPCYWARVSGLSGEFDDIIANGNPTGPTTIEVAKSDEAVEFNGGCTWSPVS